MGETALVATAVFVSGTGTNLQAVIDAAVSGALPLDLRLVLSNKPAVPALQRAQAAGIPTAVYEFSCAAHDRAHYATALADAVERCGARLVLLLGWMHVLSPPFLERGFEVLNLHPAYLPEDPDADTVVFPDGGVAPAFRGAHALRDALAAGMRQAGASLIVITPRVDRGRVLARKAMALAPGEGEADALERLHAVERDVVREGVLRWIAEQP
jgi:phosphoribosylglycinamide formyltransferase-1